MIFIEFMKNLKKICNYKIYLIKFIITFLNKFKGQNLNKKIYE